MAMTLDEILAEARRLDEARSNCWRDPSSAPVIFHDRAIDAFYAKHSVLTPTLRSSCH